MTENKSYKKIRTDQFNPLDPCSIIFHIINNRAAPKGALIHWIINFSTNRNAPLVLEILHNLNKN